MSSNVRHVVVPLLFAFLVVVSGCQGLTSEDVSEGEQIRQETVAAMDEVETATFDMQMNVTTNGGTLGMTADGAMDRADRRMRINLSMAMGPRRIESQQYVDGNTSYVNVDGEWLTQDLSDQLPEQNIWQTNQLRQQTKALENGTVELNGTTTIDGTEMYVLEVRPDEQTLKQVVQNQSPAATGALDGFALDDFQFTQYVETDTNHVRMVELTMKMTVQDQEATAMATMHFDNYDEDVSIQIPDAAKNST